jgi:uncharacterized membrane protein YoaK (UPF0700 family)
MIALGLTGLLTCGLEWIWQCTLRPLLPLQIPLLAGFLVPCVSAGLHIDPDASFAILGGMFDVATMVLRNAFVQVSLEGAPSIEGMTTNITRFMMDVGEVVFGCKPTEVAESRNRAKSTWPAILGFAVGCGLGVARKAAIGFRALVLPIGLELLTLASGLAAELDGGQGP